MTTLFEEFLQKAKASGYDARRSDARIASLDEILGLVPLVGEQKILCVSNADGGPLGACQIFKPMVQRAVAALFGGDYFILPSSIHEVLCVPYDSDDKEFLSEMVREINASVVANRDVLSDHIYKYDSEQEQIYMVG